MKILNHLSTIIAVLAALFISFISWITIAPVQWGGRAVTYIIVNGGSMEPDFHHGDLLLLRAQSSYQPGDAVTYQNQELGRWFFHRIIGTERDRYVLKGDNNSWPDSYRPAQDEIVGKLWVHIPKPGRVFEWAHAPLNLAVTMGVLGGVFMLTIITKPPLYGKDKELPPRKTKRLRRKEAPLYFTALLTFLSLGLSILSFTRPLTSTIANINEDGLVGSTSLQVNTFQIFGLQATVESIRWISLLWLGFSLVSHVLMGVYVYKAARKSRETLIYKEGEVAVELRQVQNESMEPVTKLEESQNFEAVLLDTKLPEYLIDNDENYIVTADPVLKSTPEPNIRNEANDITRSEPLQDQLLEKVMNRAENNAAGVEAIEHDSILNPMDNSSGKPVDVKPPYKETVEYVIDTGEIEFVMPEPDQTMY